jgi:3-hydroxyacyl-[acyl-carrier-protein] dehydratase
MIITIEEIKKLIPHRYPFLLVDRVLDIGDKWIKCIKNVTANEEFFNGHFPGNPIMPGVLQVEALAQAGVILTMKNLVKDPNEALVVFSAINKAKFRKPVVPGDQLLLEVELGEIRRNFMTMIAKASVDGQVTCEMEATAAMIPNKKA